MASLESQIEVNQSVVSLVAHHYHYHDNDVVGGHERRSRPFHDPAFKADDEA